MKKKKIIVLSAAAAVAISACTVKPSENIPEDVYGPPSEFGGNDMEGSEEPIPEEEGYEETTEEENR